MSNHNEEFKKLQAEWYKKAADSGFKDIEDKNNYLITFEKAKFTKRNYNGLNFGDWLNMKMLHSEYYNMARRFLYTHVFADPIEKAIWEAHSEGLGCRKISALTGIHYRKVWKIVRNLISCIKKEGVEEYESDERITNNQAL